MSSGDLFSKPDSQPDPESLAAMPTRRRRHPPLWLIPIGLAVALALLFLHSAESTGAIGAMKLPATRTIAWRAGDTQPAPHGPTADSNPQNSQPDAIDPASLPVRFQATGWVEPDPWEIRVTALAAGVIDEVYFDQGDAVQAGQPMARFISEDADLALQAAEAALKGAEAALQAAEADLRATRYAATENFAAAAAVRADHQVALDAAARLRASGSGAVPEGDREQARLRAEAAAARAKAAEAASQTANARHDEASARHKSAKAAREGARTDVAAATLRVERMTVHAPFSGTVMRRTTAPGRKHSLERDDPESATIAMLYDPSSLRARVDVPLNHIASVRIGQPTRISSEVDPDHTWTGEVIRLAGEADIQRNTIEVQVRIHDPGPLLRPETLCRVRFLDAPPQTRENQPNSNGTPEDHAPSRRSGTLVLVPEQALAGPDRKHLWIINHNHRLEYRAVVSAPGPDGHAAITDGVGAGEWVVLPPHDECREGRRATPIPTSTATTTP